MLVQSFRREIPGHDAFFDRTMMRHERFSVALLRSRGIANDYGLLMRAVKYLLRFSRTQLAILLAGHGYFDAAGRRTSLVPGDIVVSDQARGEAEGYGGSPCELLVIAWDPGDIFGMSARGEATLSRLARLDVARLRGHVAQIATSPAEQWLVELFRQLRALGLTLERDLDPRAFTVVREPLGQAYEALGETLARLDAQPNLLEVAGALGLSERQTNRTLIELERSYGHPFEGWRDFVHENRVEWALQLLSIPGVRLDRVARLAGYRSTIALCHAFSIRGVESPGTLARTLAERWG